MSPRLAHDHAATHFSLEFAPISTITSCEAPDFTAAAMGEPSTQGHAAGMTAPPRSRFWTELVITCHYLLVNKLTRIFRPPYDNNAWSPYPMQNHPPTIFRAQSASIDQNNLYPWSEHSRRHHSVGPHSTNMSTLHPSPLGVQWAPPDGEHPPASASFSSAFSTVAALTDSIAEGTEPFAPYEDRAQQDSSLQSSGAFGPNTRHNAPE